MRVLFLQLKASQYGLLQLRHSLMRQAVAVGVFLLFQYYLNPNGAVAVAGVTHVKTRSPNLTPFDAVFQFQNAPRTLEIIVTGRNERVIDESGE